MVMAVLASTLSLHSHATTVLYKNFDNLVDESDHVVGGTVSNMKARYHRDGAIYTTIILTNAFVVSETGKTETTKPIKIRYKGGEVEVYGKNGEVPGVEGLRSHGTPELTLGEQVILFVKNNGIADMPIYGWGQGLFYIDESQGVNDAMHAPVVGLDGPHLVRKTSKGLSSNKRVMPNKNADKGPASAVLVSSDGGEDIVITNAQENDAALDKLSNYSAMHVSNFVSMIQERKAMKKNKTGKPEKDLSDLFTLPEVSSAQTKASAKVSNSKDMPAAAHSSIDEIPVKPLSKPEHEDKGE